MDRTQCLPTVFQAFIRLEILTSGNPECEWVGGRKGTRLQSLPAPLRLTFSVTSQSSPVS